MNEDRSARYHTLGRRAAIASTAWSAGVLALLAVSGFSVWVRASVEGVAAAVVHSWLQPSFIVIGYVIAIGILHEVGEWPIAFYRGFLLERRYGLSTESVRHWLVDQLKGTLLGGVLSIAGFSALYAAMRNFPGWWWLVAALGFAGFIVVLTRLAPVLLMPIFFTFKPLARNELRTRLIDLSRRAGVAVTDCSEWQLSDRTKKANAALAGMGRTRRIIVSDTLLANYSDDEIEVILAHELAHQVHHDIWRGIGVQVVVVALGFFVASQTMVFFAPRLGWQGVADVAGLPVLLLTAGLLSLGLLPLANAVSRRMERAADRFALELTGNGGAFCSAMRRLGEQNLAEESPSGFARLMFYTHPPINERIAAADRWREDHS